LYHHNCQSFPLDRFLLCPISVLRQVSPYFITVYPDDGCNKKLKYVVGIVTRKEVIYSNTCLKTESGHNQNTPPAKNVYSPQDR
jgi:hypothetical protein